MCETAWLIEMSDGGLPTYWCRLDDEDGVCGWSKSADKALRFCRAQDAQGVIDEFGWTEPRPVEHMWLGQARQSDHERDEDEAYEIGKRDGYEDAIQDLDLATGGDGEFKGSTLPGGTVDVPAMRDRIIARCQR